MVTPRILLTFYYLVKYTQAAFEPAYLKVCSREYKQTVDSSECPKGVWLETLLQPKCVCVRGVWALSNGFCDKAPVILVGDGHCFHIPFEILSAKLIGDPTDPFKPSLYVAPFSLDIIFEITEGGFTPSLTSDETMIIGINPRQVAQRKDFGLCIDLDFENYNMPAHVFINPRRMSTEWILDHKKEYTCSSRTLFDHHLAYGEMFSVQKAKVEPKKLVERHCKQECPGEIVSSRLPPRKSYLAQNLGRPGDDSKAIANDTSSRTFNSRQKISTGDGSDWSSKPVGTPRPGKTFEERQMEREEMRATATQEPAYFEKEVNEQTLRMMQAHISPVLLKVPGPQVVTREYNFFQRIRSVAEKACPEEYVPKKLLVGLMRMFRQLLWESQDTFQHNENADSGQFNRTLERLEECAEKTVEPAFLFATYNESFNADLNMSAPEPERCPVPLIYSVNGTGYNRTDYNTEAIMLRNYTYMFPPHLKFNATEMDIVIETAWKITMIGHYRCSKYFDDETAIEFSHFFHQVQSFFNHKIIKRWYYPKSIPATYDVVKMIFPSYNLQKFMFGLDSCLMGSQGFSDFDFNHIWMQRPKFPHTKEDLMSTVDKDKGSLLSTKDYAPDPVGAQPRAPREAEITPGTEFKVASSNTIRRKRETGGYNLWNNGARCLNEYLDPIWNQEDFRYQLPSDCASPVDMDQDYVIY